MVSNRVTTKLLKRVNRCDTIESARRAIELTAELRFIVAHTLFYLPGESEE